jgi:hypothetical protein
MISQNQGVVMLEPRHDGGDYWSTLEASRRQGFESDEDLGREIGDRVALILDKGRGGRRGRIRSLQKQHTFFFLQSIVCHYIKMMIMGYKRIKIDSMAEKRMYIGWHVICNTCNKFNWRLPRKALFGSYELKGIRK